MTAALAHERRRTTLEVLALSLVTIGLEVAVDGRLPDDPGDLLP
jgi:hypothetical protein